MSLKWKDKVDGVDEILADDINTVAHAVIDNEKNISNKVSKEDGKGLSTNDFTDEHKFKLDNLEETISKKADVAYVDNELDKKADKSNTYTKYEANSKFIQKSDITNVYKFKGSVKSYNDLPVSFKIIPNGNPTLNGVEVGTFDAEERSITFDEEITYDGWDVQIPIETIVLPKGEYYINSDMTYVYNASDYDNYNYNLPLEISEETEVTVIGFGYPANDNIASGKQYLGSVDTAYYDENGRIQPLIVSNGDVYNTLDTGVNYAWTGTEWDALGGASVSEQKIISEPIDTFEGVAGEFFKDGKTTVNSTWEWAKIPVKEGEEYIVTGTGNNYVHAINYCDAELNVISNTTETGTQSFIDEKITIPQGCYFVVLNRQKNNSAIQFNITKLVKTSFKPNKLKGKTIVNFGDSIFGMARPPYDVSTYLAELTEANVLNCGFGGCTMSEHNSTAHDPLAMYRLADAITSGDFTLQDNSLANNSSLPDYFDIGIQTLKSVDFNEVDIITIGYGINDYLKNKDVDNESNALDTNTYGGALRYSIEKILTVFPHIKVFVCSQTYMATLDSSYNYVTDSDTETNTIGKKLTDYVEKAKEISSSYHLKYIDNYYSLGINKFNRGVYFPKSDGVHHNRQGRNLIASHIAKELF